jgi:hypothetical protein
MAMKLPGQSAKRLFKQPSNLSSVKNSVSGQFELGG